MKVEFKFKNGQTVKEIITGFQGIIDSQGLINTGNIQYSVQPYTESGKNTRPDAWFIDEDSLELIEDKLPNKGKYEVEFLHDNGFKVIDIISGFEGTIDRSVLCLNDCVQYLVKGRFIKSLGKVASIWVDEKNIRLVSEGVSKELKPKRTGGPSSRSTQRDL